MHEICLSGMGPHYIKDVKKLEGIQSKAAQFVTGNRERTEGTITHILADLE